MSTLLKQITEEQIARSYSVGSQDCERRNMSPWTGSKLLVRLPKGTPRIKYINMRELQGAIKSRASECYEDGCKGTFLVVTAIPSTFITEVDEFYGDRSPGFAINIDESLAVVETMHSKPREILAQNLVIHIGSATSELAHLE
ncbi:hypothetical protein TRV_06683 [Trichophyton verrucosum HKI 0517]|uniref:Uncharacterized protein n=1 Tax=Trichophyton verrucosum (strain HKI 0517) TaxID=663202 RepID=D4DHM7_TRIVH|nr:uncharacterized protein TRV_06683 [Trichophyton verrucosum HKI 0517]EFE38634.1 hypothetical protein TRV_06683 [Trichophyton verrucosum HKI 0517]